MTAQIAAYGCLGTDPVERQSQAGKAWATASVAVSLSDEEGAPAQWFSLVAFGKAAETLASHKKADLISVSGRLKLNRWTDREGVDHEQLQIVAEAVVSARSVRPGGRRRGGDAQP